MFYVLGSLLFTVYIQPLGFTIHHLGLYYQVCPVDTYFLASGFPSLNVSSRTNHVVDCVKPGWLKKLRSTSSATASPSLNWWQRLPYSAITFFTAFTQDACWATAFYHLSGSFPSACVSFLCHTPDERNSAVAPFSFSGLTICNSLPMFLQMFLQI